MTPVAAWPPLDVYASKASIVLEVINTHFTVGREYKSVYLRVFSDRVAECHYVRYGMEGEADKEKTKLLSPSDFKRLRSVLENPELASVNDKYGLMHWVVDSWMTWDIDVHRETDIQKIEIVSFSPSSARERGQPYPDAVLKLGCAIWQLRREVYGRDSANDPMWERRSCDEELGK